MSKKIICITTVIVIMFVSFTGCSVKGTKRDLSSLAIVIGLAIDKNEGDSQGFETFGDEQARILMTAQVVRNDSVGQQGGSGQGADSAGKGDVGKPYWNVEVVGGNLLEAIRAATHVTNRSLYLAQNQVVVISSDIAKEGIAKYLDFFFRDHETRYDVSLIIAEGNAGKILATESHLDNLPAQDLYKLINSQKRDSGTPDCTLFSFIRDYKTEYKSALVPFVRVIEPKEEQRSPFLFVAGSSIFVEDKMVGILDEKQTRGVLWVSDRVTDGVVALDFDGIAVSLEVINSKGSFTAEYSDGKIKVKSKVEAKLSLGEYQGQGKFDTEKVKMLEKMCEEEIKKEINEGFEKIREKSADVLGIGNYFYRFKYKQWQKIQEDFLEMYKNANMEIEVDAQIIRTGSLLKPIDANSGGKNE